MAEYIKRSDVMEICQEYSSHCFTTNDANGQDIADRIENDIIKLPTADVVEVIRCEECSSARKCFACYKCRVTGERHNGGHYCSYGKRKETE